MMVSVQKFAYQRLNKAEVSTFNFNLLSVLIACVGNFGKGYQVFKEAADEYDAAYKDQGMEPSRSLADFDKAADNAWSSFNAQVKASVIHPRAEVREAAEQVKKVFSKTANPIHKSHEVAFAELRTLISRLEELPDGLIVKALLDEHLTLLRETVRDFGLAKSGLVDQTAEKKNNRLKEAREKCYDAWIILATVLEAGAFNETIPGVEKAIARINVITDALRSRLQNRGDNSEENEKESNVFDEISEDVDAIDLSNAETSEP